MKLNFRNFTEDKFEEKALEIFAYQSKVIPIYKEYINRLGIDASSIKSIDQIPFLPISFFKTHEVFDSSKEKKFTFTSSGTTGANSSKHFVADIDIYEQSFKTSFSNFFGSIKDYCFLALLPSYLERGGSSLIYMSEKLIEESQHPLSGFYLHNLDALSKILKQLESEHQKTILIGVSYALLDLIEHEQFRLKNTIVIETGGMKGQRKDMIKEEFYSILKQGFGLDKIYSEYGMTELLSQAYSMNNGKYKTPAWMKILIRDINDPFCYIEKEKTGGINIIDLANIDSCSFIATQDLGRLNLDSSFSILGRFDNSDIRGCNLMIN